MATGYEGQFSDADEDGVDRYRSNRSGFVAEENWDDENDDNPPDSNSEEINSDDINSDDSDFDDIYNYISLDGNGGLTNRVNNLREGRHKCNNNPASVSTMQPGKKVLEQKYNNRIILDKFSGLSVNRDHKADRKIILKDKSDRATIQQVLDPRTARFLLKTMKKCKLLQVYGCISTGKEANVYYAVDENDKEFAIKIYKTACMTFKNREKYIAGNHNTKYGYSKSKNSFKMVQTWAEKELRNLGLLKSKAVDIYSPEAFALKGNVLTMEFIGKDGIPAQKLKDADISLDKACEVYRDLVIAVRKMYTQCKLVHADLSEYNILYFDERPYIIDVSQSVSPEHPSAYEFLKNDISNITNFFHKKGVLTMLPSVFFYFVVNDSVKDEHIDRYLQHIENETKNTEASGPDSDVNAEEVFRQLYIPRFLNEMTTFENDFMNLKSGQLDASDLPYVKVLGIDVSKLTLKEQEQKNNFVQEAVDYSSTHEDIALENSGAVGGIADCCDTMEDEEDCEEQESTDSDLADTNEMTAEEFALLKQRRRPLGRPKDETREEKLKRLGDVKKQKSEKRKVKMPKKLKKQLQKKSKKR